MVIFSSLNNALKNAVLRSPSLHKTVQVPQRVMSGHHNTIPLTPTRWHWQKFKDLTHFYMMLGAIPLAAVTLYANIFIGPATLQEIPEGYTPKYWEYYRSPISRFFARYIMNNPQQDYEKYLAYLYMENEKRLLRQLDKQVLNKMAERHDYEAYYYRPIMAKYHRVTKEAADNLKEMYGD